MTINSAWYLCIAVRLSLIALIYTNRQYYNVLVYVLFALGIFFSYNAHLSANAKTLGTKPYLYNTSYANGLLYLLAAYSLQKNEINAACALLLSDVIFSVSNRYLQTKLN